MPNILPISSVIYTSVPVHGVTKLGIRSHPTGSSAPETTAMTFSPNWFTTSSFRLVSLCQPTHTLAGPVFSHLWNPCPILSMRSSQLSHASTEGWGANMAIPRFRYLDPFGPQAPYQMFAAQSLNFGPPPLGYSVTGPSSYDRYRQHYSSFLYQQTGHGQFLQAVTSSSGSVYVASNSGIVR